MDTFGKTLARHNGVGPGFDFLRIALATCVVAMHAMQYTANTWIFDRPFWFAEYSVVPMFFALSGFLVTGSGLRLSLGNFLLNRGLRIAPALSVEIFASALIIGPLVTTWTLGAYFRDTQFWLYFTNIFGIIHYNLPGVFQDHYLTYVNGALWTVPYEIICYIITSILIKTKLIHNVSTIVALTVGFIAIGVFLQFSHVLGSMGEFTGKAVKFVFYKREAQLVTAFLFGMIAYQMKEIIPRSRWLLAGAVLLCAIAAVCLDVSQTFKPATRIVLLPALTYITIYLGLTEIGLPAWLKKGDYSYGLYLYHNPLLQIVIGIFPQICMQWIGGGLFTFVVTLPIAFGMAYVSWHLIEKPTLALRKRFSFAARAHDLRQPAAEPLVLETRQAA